jgi:hypothetical protein
MVELDFLVEDRCELFYLQTRNVQVDGATIDAPEEALHEIIEHVASEIGILIGMFGSQTGSDQVDGKVEMLIKC